MEEAESTGFAQGDVFSRDAEVRGGWQGRQPHREIPSALPGSQKVGKHRWEQKIWIFLLKHSKV